MDPPRTRDPGLYLFRCSSELDGSGAATFQLTSDAAARKTRKDGGNVAVGGSPPTSNEASDSPVSDRRHSVRHSRTKQINADGEVSAEESDEAGAGREKNRDDQIPAAARTSSCGLDSHGAGCEVRSPPLFRTFRRSCEVADA